MDVRPIPCLADNYAYLLVRDGHAVVVDPSEAAPVLAALKGLVLDAIWCTHHHWDHVGGVPGLLATGRVPVVGGRYDSENNRIEGQSVAFDDGDTFPVFGVTAKVHAIPGHTLGAIAYEIDGHLFSGDTLFTGGCGRIFEGTPQMMRASMNTLLGLDPALRLWPGHEYTLNNLTFALHLAAEPAVEARLADTRTRRDAGLPAIGDTLALERATNPFLRWDAPTIRAAAARLGADPGDPDEVFAAIRHAKDRW